MNEKSFIKNIKQPYYEQSTLQKGIGDDAAVLRQTTKDIVTAVDTFVEDVHFSKKTMANFQIGYRALAANLSDLAAMGACPAFYLVSVVVPHSWSEQEILDVYSGMARLAKRYHLDLIGGDTVSGTKLTLSITIIGYIQKGKARYRSHSRHNDIVFVTGTLGDSQAGLYLLKNNKHDVDRDYFIQRHQQPIPRLEFSQGLQRITRVALNDISDGIATEAREIATDSHVSIILKDDKLPIHRSFSQFPSELQTKWTYFGGEDYELIGTVAREYWNQVKSVGKETNTKVTKVGYVAYNESTVGQVFVDKDGKKRQLRKMGYTHF